MGGLTRFLFVAALSQFRLWFMSSRKALETTVAEMPYTPEKAPGWWRALKGTRSLVWTTGEGPDTINMRRRGKDRRITMSITIEPQPAGGTRVSMWASQYNEYLEFLANFSYGVNGRKRAIGRLLTAAPPFAPTGR